MAGANSNIQLVDLDFNSLKTSLKTFLQSQDTLRDYNYDGAALSVLLDILAYNTQYNAYYLNMVGNEMFLDSAIQRSSVVSHAKLLSYTPRSAIAPTATIDLQMNQVTTSSLTLPKFTYFLSEAIDGVNYNFVTTDAYTVNVSANTALFENVEIKQGLAASTNFTVDTASNPTLIFELPESNIDTTTLQVVVQESGSNSSSQVYELATNYLEINNESQVYWLQESLNGTYQIYFGDGVLGQSLIDGNIVKTTYLLTQGTASAGANNFVLMDPISGFSNNSITPITSASQGGDRETIDSIKYQAPKAYAAQGRAVTKDDYITAIQQNTLGYSFDAVNVWGGEDNDPVVYGQVFVALKPTGGYTLTTTQKQRILDEVIKPISVLTVTPTIIEPDYTYIKLSVNVYYDPTKTTQTATQIQQGVKTAISNFGTRTLNTFNSTFNAYDLLNSIQSYDSSIITSEYSLQLQKKFYPNLKTPTTYQLLFNTPLERGLYLSGVTSNPSMVYKNPITPTTFVDGIYIEEVPQSTNGVDSLSILNPGYGYTSAPTITILGDGVGATAHAVVSGGSIKSIVVDNAGSGYTSAIATITPVEGDSTGQLGAATVNLQGRYGTLRTYYNDNQNVKTIFDSDIGTIDYTKGIITLNSFSPYNVNNPLGQLAVGAKPQTSIISSTYNSIITIDPYDPNAITVNVIAKV